jgi:hypothetical protein
VKPAAPAGFVGPACTARVARRPSHFRDAFFGCFRRGALAEQGGKSRENQTAAAMRRFSQDHPESVGGAARGQLPRTPASVDRRRPRPASSLAAACCATTLRATPARTPRTHGCSATARPVVAHRPGWGGRALPSHVNLRCRSAEDRRSPRAVRRVAGANQDVSRGGRATRNRRTVAAAGGGRRLNRA